MEDLGISTEHYDGKQDQTSGSDNALSQEKQEAIDFRELVDCAISVICDFHRYWWKVREAELPDRNGEWSDLFCTAVENINLATEWLKVLENGEEDEKRELLNHICNR